MRRLHVIDDFDRMGGEVYFRGEKERFMHDPELREAFEAGCEHGYHKAMKEMDGGYNERTTHWGGQGGRDILYRGGRDGMNYRDDDDDMDYRRRRSSRTGRYM